MKGHLGTLLLQKSSDVFQCSKAHGVLTATETDSRNLPIEDFSFYIDGHGIPHPTQGVADRKVDATRERIINILQEVYETAYDTFTYTELVDAYALHAALGKKSAKKYIRTAKEMGLLDVEGNRYKCKGVKGCKTCVIYTSAKAG